MDLDYTSQNEAWRVTHLKNESLYTLQLGDNVGLQLGISYMSGDLSSSLDDRTCPHVYLELHTLDASSQRLAFAGCVVGSMEEMEGERVDLLIPCMRFITSVPGIKERDERITRALFSRIKVRLL